MYSFIIMKQYCTGTSVGNKLSTLQWSFKVCPKYNNLPVNNIPHRRVSTEVGIQRLKNVNTKCRTLLNTKHQHQNVSMRWYKDQTKFDINTNVKNNVLLYKHVTPAMTVLRISMHIYILMWALTISYILYMNSKEVKNMSFKQMVNHFCSPRPIDIIIYMSGPLLYLTGWVFISRIIKFIILRKGGEEITIITHHALFNERCITCPTSKVYCHLSPATQIPSSLKIKGHYGYYLFNAKGRYMNRSLFDHTVVPMKV